MPAGKFGENEEGTVGLPIRIVVLSIVGFIGFYAILSAIYGAPSPPEPLYAHANVSAIFLPAGDENITGNNTDNNLTILVTVLDRENRRVGGANVVLWSPDRARAGSDVTDAEGKAVVKLENPELPPGKAEGYIALKVMKPGYRDFENDYFVKVVRV